MSKALEDAEKKLEQAKARLSQIKARETARKRKEDARVKIILGAAVLVYLEKRSVNSANQMRAVISASLSEKDREFLSEILMKVPEPPKASE